MRAIVFLLLLTSSAALATYVQQPHAINRGGTGRSTLTSNNVLVGNGTSQVSLVPEVDGQCLQGVGGVWVTGTCGSGGGGSSTSTPVKFTLSGGVAPWTNIDGYHQVRSASTLTEVRMTMGSCGGSGTVAIGIIKNDSEATQLIWNPTQIGLCTSVAFPSVSFAATDAVSVNVDSATATGQDLTVELIGI